MIIKKDLKNKNNTIYKCDRCKRKITRENNYKVFIKTNTDKQPVKKWDLCDRCYKSLEKGIGGMQK